MPNSKLGCETQKPLQYYRTHNTPLHPPLLLANAEHTQSHNFQRLHFMELAFNAFSGCGFCAHCVCSLARQNNKAASNNKAHTNKNNKYLYIYIFATSLSLCFSLWLLHSALPESLVFFVMHSRWHRTWAQHGSSGFTESPTGPETCSAGYPCSQGNYGRRNSVKWY